MITEEYLVELLERLVIAVEEIAAAVEGLEKDE